MTFPHTLPQTRPLRQLSRFLVRRSRDANPAHVTPWLCRLLSLSPARGADLGEITGLFVAIGATFLAMILLSRACALRPVWQTIRFTRSGACGDLLGGKRISEARIDDVDCRLLGECQGPRGLSYVHHVVHVFVWPPY